MVRVGLLIQQSKVVAVAAASMIGWRAGTQGPNGMQSVQKLRPLPEAEESWRLAR